MDLSTSDYTDRLMAGTEVQLRSPDPSKNPTGLFVQVLGMDAPLMRERLRTLQREQMALAATTQGQEKNWAEYFEVEMACEALLNFRGGTGSVTTVADLRKFLRGHPDGFFYSKQIVRASESTSRFFGNSPGD